MDRFLFFFCLFFSVILMTAGVGYTQGNVPPELEDIVIQGTDGIHFAQNAGPTTIYINYEELDNPEIDQVDFEMLREDDVFKAHFEAVPFTTNIPGYQDDMIAVGVTSPDKVGYPMVRYKSGDGSLKRGKDNFFGGALFRYIYKDAAKTMDGRTLNVILTYSDLHIFVESKDSEEKPISDDYKGNVYIAFGDMLRTGNDIVYEGTNNYRYGMIVNAHFQAVTKEGEVVPGTVLYAVTDIDVNREISLFRRVHEANKYRNFTEGIAVYRDSITPDKIYIPDPLGKDNKNPNKSYKCEIEFDEERNAVLFYAGNKGGEQDPGTYYSGFCTVVNNEVGLKLTAYSSGGAAYNQGGFPASVRTKLLKVLTNPPLNHKIHSSSTENGTIEFKWKDYHEGPGIISVMDGTSPVYTMKPKENARIYSLRIGDTIGDNETRRFFNQEDLLSMKVGDKISVDIKSGREGVLEYTGNGQYTFTFENNNEDHRIHVVWEKWIDIEVQKVWKDAGHEAARPKQITVRLHRQGDLMSSAVLKASDGWKPVRFTGLLEKDGGDEGKLIDYTITEDRIHNYIHRINEDQNPVVITNTYDPGKTSLNIEKIWRLDDERTRPDHVVVRLFADGIDTGKTLTLKASEHWYNEFEELDELKAGKPIVYTIQEEPIPGYSGKVTGNPEIGFTLVNTPSGDPSGMPATGDTERPLLYLAFLVCCGVGFFLCGRMKKKP